MTEVWIHETFDGPEMDLRLQWLNPPSRWSIDLDLSSLVVEPEARTDFWQRTYYGIDADSGHFLYAPVPGDMILTTRVRFHPANQYDQAGLMVRLARDCWLKASVEFEPTGPSRLGTAVTNFGYSDWSTEGFPGDRNELWLRVRREGKDCIAEHSADGNAWSTMRIAHLHNEGVNRHAMCGLYCCSPTGAGYRVEFDFLKILLGQL